MGTDRPVWFLDAYHAAHLCEVLFEITAMERFRDYFSDEKWYLIKNCLERYLKIRKKKKYHDLGEVLASEMPETS